MLNWVEVDGDAVLSNLREFQRRLGDGVRLGAVVKSNAYGHGMLEVAALAREAGVRWLCVNNVDEAVELRSGGHHGPILVLGYVPYDRLSDVVEHGLRPVVANAETLARLETLASPESPLPVHLKLETGTHRQGISESDVVRIAGTIADSRVLQLEGISTHFANIEDSTDHSFAEAQIAAFERVGATLARAGIDVPIRHAACSAATLLFTRTHLDLVRVGISVYGLWPSKETYVSLRERGKPALALRPALTWKTRVGQVKLVEEGSYIGYGCTYRVTRRSTIAVLPVGYHEGYDRGLSGVGYVLVHGRRAPIRGRVCMNMCMVDVTDIPGVALEDEVVLLGRQGEETIRAEQLADWCGTIAYEVVARINPSLARVVVRRESGQPLPQGRS
ncbi:MAG TPA: alanine racemase [Candidatus Polarisedimenticolaceae bacterium]|nr:alanine racemase [Candidatus Polarisedimenticolaceae bacterium]